ncbi:MAG: AAA family ATPase, partial [Planctomycetes bacterium]|nr:AAA family ATPase [Planctomycetota bacterium]
MNVKAKIEEEVQQILNRPLILNRRFLDDEQLIRAEQVAVLEEIFNANVRDREIREISAHFAPILRGDHPVHLALWGKTGTGKTLTTIYFLNLLAEMCHERNVPIRHVQLNLSTPQPCFRALNDLACLLNACKRYRKGISLEELMGRIEGALAGYRGYLILFIDEVDNVRRDHDTFLAFLIRRLPQRIPAKLILIFASNRLNWMEHLDPRVQSFLKVNELIFDPYDAVDLQRILNIRVEKALRSGAARPGVIEKIAALSSRDHGDARKAVALLASSASLAEKAGSAITLQTVDQASERIEQDKYTTMIRTAPRQLQAALAAAINAFRVKTGATINTGEVYEAYQRFCRRVGLRPLAGRAFGDLLAELGMYAFLHARVQSRGR